METNFSKYGREINSTGDKKINKMHRAAEIMEHFINNNFIELAEEKFGKLPTKPFKLELIGNVYYLRDNNTPEENELQTKIFNYADKLSKEEWDELWLIFRGQNRAEFSNWLKENRHKYTNEQLNNGDAWIDWFDGSGLDNWAD